MKPTDLWIESMQQSGCRITSPRRTIIEILLTSQQALEPLQIYDLGRARHPGMGLVTVYRTLEKLEDLGLIQHVHRDDGCHMVMKAASGHEHYLICTSCGRTTLFKGDDLSKLIANVEGNSGYQVRDHWLQLFGVCPTCQSQQPKET
jgi:Fe2+ or Zn2+ uptake regulation protein